MGKHFLISILIYSIVVGCTTMQIVHENSNDTLLAEISTHSRFSDARIELTDAQIKMARDIVFEQDTVYWRDADTRTLDSLSLQRIHKITFTNRGRGFWQGYLIGFIIGTPIGVISGIASGDDPPEGLLGTGTSAGEKAIYRGAITGGVGSAIGGIIGVVRGNRTIYEFKQRDVHN